MEAVTVRSPTPQLIPQPDKKKLLMHPAKLRVSQILPHPQHGLDVSANHPNTVVNKQTVCGVKKSWEMLLTSQLKDQECLSSFWVTEHFWLLSMEPRSVLRLNYSTDVKQHFRDPLAAWHIRSQ